MSHDEIEPMDRSGCVERLQQLGQLVEASGLAELVDDDRAALFGSFTELADRVRDLVADGVDSGHLIDRWARRGRRASRADPGLLLSPSDGRAVKGSSRRRPFDESRWSATAARDAYPRGHEKGFHCPVCNCTIPLATAAHLAADIRSTVRELGAIGSPSPRGGTAAAGEGRELGRRGCGAPAERASSSRGAPVLRVVEGSVPGSPRRVAALDRHVGSRIREWRGLHDVSQKQLAEAVGVSLQQICKYERGMSRVSASRLFAIASALGAPISWFFGESAASPGEANSD